MIVTVYNRMHFHRLFPDKNICAISISTISNILVEYDKMDIIELHGWKDSLELKFDDIIDHESMDEYKQQFVTFDDTMACLVLDFIHKNKGSEFVIHCDAGISRSVAIASFMEYTFGYKAEYPEIGHDGYRNSLVFRLLNKNEWYDTDNQ